MALGFEHTTQRKRGQGLLGYGERLRQGTHQPQPPHSHTLQSHFHPPVKPYRALAVTFSAFWRPSKTMAAAAAACRSVAAPLPPPPSALMAARVAARAVMSAARMVGRIPRRTCLR
mgnify:CR=1 FL=1